MYQASRFLGWIFRSGWPLANSGQLFRSCLPPSLTPVIAGVYVSQKQINAVPVDSISKKAEQLGQLGQWAEAIQMYNQALVQAVQTHGNKNWNVIEPTRDLCWAIHRYYETDPADSDDLRMATVLLHQAYHIAADADIDEDRRQTEMAAICEQLSAIFLELNESENALLWIEKAISHLSRCQCKEAHLPRFLVHHSTCLNESCRYEEAESVARSAIAFSKYDSENMCLAYFQLGSALECISSRSNEASAAFEQAVRIARKRGASMKSVRLESESRLAMLSATPRKI